MRLFATPRAGRLEDSLDLLLQMVFDERNTHVTPTAPSSEQTVVVIGFANRWCGTESEHWSQTYPASWRRTRKAHLGHYCSCPCSGTWLLTSNPGDFIAALPADTVLSDEIFAELSAVVSVGNEYFVCIAPTGGAPTPAASRRSPVAAERRFPAERRADAAAELAAADAAADAGRVADAAASRRPRCRRRSTHCSRRSVGTHAAWLDPQRSPAGGRDAAHRGRRRGDCSPEPRCWRTRRRRR